MSITVLYLFCSLKINNMKNNLVCVENKNNVIKKIMTIMKIIVMKIMT